MSYFIFRLNGGNCVVYEARTEREAWAAVGRVRAGMSIELEHIVPKEG